MNRWLSHLVIAVLIIFLSGYFLPFEVIQNVNAVGTIFVIIFSLYKSHGPPKAFGIIMFLVATSILWSKQVSLDTWIYSFMKNLPIISLILLVPILTIPINLGGYNEQIRRFIQQYSKKGTVLFFFISSTFFILGPILNLGSIRIVDDMVKTLKFPSEFLAKAYTRGFTSVITWSPYFASAFIVVYYLDVSLTKILPLGFVMGIVQFAFGNLLFSWEGSNRYTMPEMQKTAVNGKKLIELIIIISILTLSILLLEHLVSFNMVVIVTFTVFIISMLWSFYLRKIRGFWREISCFSSSILPGRANEIVLFLLSGYFSSAIALTSFGEIIRLFLVQLSHKSVFLLIFSIIFIISFLALLGIHQVVSVTSIIATVSAQELGVTNVILALAYLSAWSISSIVSPLAAVNVTISSLLKIKLTNLIFKNNLIFSIGSLIIHSSLIYLFHLLF